MPANHGSGLRITDQPTNAAVSTGSSSATPGDWTPVKGATSRSLVVSANTMSGLVVQYAATFTNSKGSVTTRAASVYEVMYGQKWAGYIDVTRGARQFSTVSGTWTIPTATCGATTAEESIWVGIDGWTISKVEQVGTFVQCLDGLPSYYAYYEMWGNAALNGGLEVFLPTASDPVAPGDAVSATVSLANGQWVFTVDDTTAGWSSSNNVVQPVPPPAQSSAEWIVEAPLICVDLCKTATLAETTPVTFASARATQSGETGTVSSWPTQAVAIENTTQALDQVSALDPTGASFTVTYSGGSG